MEYYNEFALKCRAERLKSTTKPKIPKYDYPGRDEYKAIPSIEGTGIGTKAEPKQYTGDKMLGIATMHKSNSVPIFSQEEAEAVSKMRRG